MEISAVIQDKKGIDASRSQMTTEGGEEPQTSLCIMYNQSNDTSYTYDKEKAASPVNAIIIISLLLIIIIILYACTAHGACMSVCTI